MAEGTLPSRRKDCRCRRIIPEDGASKVIPVDGKLVTRGLIDMHCHPSAGLVNIGRRIDETGFYSGVTTL